MVERIRNAQVAEEIAAQAGTDATPPLFLSEALTPVIFGPQRPPLASSGYFPGCVGLNLTGVALNTSHAGLFVSGTNTDTIVRINRITIMNSGAGESDYNILRLDDASGFSITPLVPGYINAGNPSAGGIFSAIRNNTVAAQGDSMGVVVVEPGEHLHIDGPWILNNGALVVAPIAVNTRVQVYMNYEAWSSIRRQRAGG